MLMEMCVEGVLDHIYSLPHAVPFNGGPRICIGQQFALTEMAYTIVRILQTYERIESRQDAFPKFRSDIVLQPAEGVKVAFYK